MSQTIKYRAPALDKGLDILELLARTHASLTMTEIAQGVGYSKGEIFRMLQVLEERGYIARGEVDAAYALTNRLFMLGMEQPKNRSLVEAALPVMHRLAEQINHPCHLVVASQEQIVVVARVDAPSDLGFVVRIGHRRPIAQSTSGAVLFAFQSEEMQMRWLSLIEKHDHGFKRRSFLEKVAHIRKQGYANLRSAAVDAVTDLSAPVMQNGCAVGALTIPFVDRHPSKLTVKFAVDRLRAAVSDVSAVLIA